MLQGIQSLQLSLPPLIAGKVSANHAGMTPMERFKLETLGGPVIAGDMSGTRTHNIGEHVSCFSCRATVDARSDEGGHSHPSC